MKPIRIITWITTVFFTLFFLFSWGKALNVQTRYGSPGTSLPYILGLFAFCAIIPGIFWIITYFVEKNNNSDTKSENKPLPTSLKFKKADNSNDPEISELSKQTKELESEIIQHKETYSIVKESFEQKLISKEKFELQDQKLRLEFDVLVQKKKKLKIELIR